MNHPIKWNRIPVEEVERELFQDGTPLECYFVVGEVLYGAWLDGQAYATAQDDDELNEACIRYLLDRGAHHFPWGEAIPNQPPDAGGEVGS